MVKVYLPTTSETVVHSCQHYPQVWPHLPSLQGLVLNLLSTQVSSNTWIFPRKHKVVIIMTWVQHNNTTMNTSTSCLANGIFPGCTRWYLQSTWAHEVLNWGSILTDIGHALEWWSFLLLSDQAARQLLAKWTAWDFQPWRLGDDSMGPFVLPELEWLHMNLNSERS